MAATDRTHLAALGFSDPDKREPDHDIACRYLARECPPAIFDRLCSDKIQAARQPSETDWNTARKPGHSNQSDAQSESLVRAAFAHAKTRGRDLYSIPINVGELKLDYAAELERPISKGTGQYKVTIGFLDVYITGLWAYTYDALDIDTQHYHMPPNIDDPNYRASFNSILAIQKGQKQSRWIANVGIEVKIQRRPLTDVIRQINLYREYCPSTTWALSAPWDLTAGDLETLANANVHFLPLGAKFQAFKQRETTERSTVDVAEI